MNDLADKKCIPCEGNIPAFKIEEIHKYLKKVDGWHVKEDKLEIKTALEKLNNGGHLIVLVPAHQKIYSKLDEAVGHFKRYDIDFFKKNRFENSKIVKLYFLDVFGYLLYYANKIFFKEETYPSNWKIFIWDKIFTPLTIVIDFLTAYKFGKNILCIYQNND